MNAKPIESKFATVGARLKMREIRPLWGRVEDYSIDIRRDRDGEFFELRIPEALRDRVDVTVMQADPKERHLLLLVRRTDREKQLDRFLCGHDERHWFVAAVPGGASSVAQAKESLKPVLIRAAQAEGELTARQRNRRKNRAFRRQGEWFFAPAGEWAVDSKHILHNEPLRRGAGKPHIVEQLYRTGGIKVYVSSKYPNGLEEAAYRRLLQSDPQAAQWGWRTMQRDPVVYARGTVRHSDHATITLPIWHRVIMNTETQSRTMAKVAFLD